MSARQKGRGGQFPKKPRVSYNEEVRGGGLEPEETVEMIEVFPGQCCAMWRVVAPFGPQGPIHSEPTLQVI